MKQIRYIYAKNINGERKAGIVDVESKIILCYCEEFAANIILDSLIEKQSHLIKFSKWIVEQDFHISETVNGFRWREDRMGGKIFTHEAIIKLYEGWVEKQ